MNVVGVIPARFASTRFPGKPLAVIAGKPLLQWVIEGARQAKSLQQIIVATDHPDIEKLAKACGATVAMTDPDLPSGTDRVWAAVKERQVDVVLNIQGDEPLLTGEPLDALTKPFAEDKSVEMATLARTLKAGDLASRQTAKIVLDRNRDAIYFSRLAIPYSRTDAPPHEAICLKHIGVYAFRNRFLQQFCELGPVPLEQAEGLEQLRALYLGAKIRVVQVEHESWGVDVPEDVAKIESLLKKLR